MPKHPEHDDVSGLPYGEYMEGWKTIVEFENYEINHLSQVRNKKTKRIIKPTKSDIINIYDKYGRSHTKYIYHLTLQTFFQHIPRNGRDCDHIDEDHSNHHIDNLQWIQRSSNASKSNRLRPRNNVTARSKPIEQWTKDGTTRLTEFTSAVHAARETGINQGSISACARGKLMSSGGYVWKFKPLESQKDIPGEKWATNHVLQKMLSHPNIRISNMGRVMTATGIKTKGNKTKGSCGHRMFQGYGVHQLVWAVWGDGRPVPKRGDNLVICHNDSIPRDEDGCVLNAIEYLRLDTQIENMKEYHREKAQKHTHSKI